MMTIQSEADREESVRWGLRGRGPLVPGREEDESIKGSSLGFSLCPPAGASVNYSAYCYNCQSGRPLRMSVGSWLRFWTTIPYITPSQLGLEQAGRGWMVK
jgi:hypothetical protein